VESSCEHGNEPSCSIKYCEFLEWLSDYRLLLDSTHGISLHAEEFIRTCGGCWYSTGV
jgi:hypothetical protein